MTQAFYTGVSGLKTHQTAIDIVSDNIANISTIGFRGYRPEFSTIFEETLNSTSAKPTNDTTGYGVMLSTAAMDKGQGSILLSENSTDLAIVGNGWFGVSGSAQTMYTRAGNFTFDVDSDLVTQDGHYVLGTLGKNINDNNELTTILDEVKLGDIGSQDKLRFPKNLTYPPEPSTEAKFMGNIGTEDAVQTIGTSVVDPQNNKNHLKLSFTKIDPQILPGSQWNVVATTQTLDGQTIYDTKTGVVEFSENGGLISTDLTTIDNNGAQVAIDMGSGFDGVVAISNVAVSASSISDGTIGGDLVGYSINKNAEVIATFTNGMQSSVGKIAVYHFVNEQGLERAGGANYFKSDNSGDPLFYKDANGENIIGTNVINYKLENSNVRMDVALTDLIILQKSYDANAKCVTTADQMIQKALQMHR